MSLDLGCLNPRDIVLHGPVMQCEVSFKLKKSMKYNEIIN
jgi:hypothetical protein